jgi:hypothetical protein
MYALLLGQLGLSLHAVEGLVGVEAGGERRRIELELGREALQVGPGEGASVLTSLLGEELIVVVPEAVLVGGALGRLSGPDRLLAQEGKMAPGETRLARRDERLLELTPWTQGELSAEWSLEIAPLGNLN